MHKKLEWTDTGLIKTAWKGPIFSVDEVERVAPDGRSQDMIVCRAPDWVTIVPEISTEHGFDFLMVRQYRQGSAELSCEFPAGVVDPGEKALDAAIRELQEETGYTAREMIQIASINPNPAFMDNSSTTFLARGLEKTHELKLDDNEFLEWKKESFDHIQENMGQGEYNSAIMVQSWYFYLKYKGFINKS